MTLESPVKLTATPPFSSQWGMGAVLMLVGQAGSPCEFRDGAVGG